MNEAIIDEVLRHHAGEPGALLPVLHDIQERLGFIPAESLALIASELNLSRAEVHGVVTYYSHFRQQPAPAHALAICKGEACQAMGCARLIAQAERALACKLHGTSADGQVLLEAAYCLGLCASSPALMLDGQVHARVDAARLDELIAKTREPA